MYFQYMNVDLDALAGRQHGVLSRQQVLAAGVSQTQLDRLLASGQLHRVAQGVYRSAGAPRTAIQRVVVAALSLAGPVHHAVISHESAAVLLGFHGFAFGGLPTLTMPRGGTARSSIARVRTTKDLPPEEVMTHATGLPITTALRTVVDLAMQQRSAQRLDRLLDRALLDRHASVDELWPMFLRRQARGRRGGALLRHALHVRSGDYAPAESELEHLALETLAVHAEPPPTRQHPLPGPLRGRVDLAYPEARLLIELDGATHRLIETALHDQRRDAAAAVAGWQVIRFGWELVRYDGAWFAATVSTVRLQRTALFADRPQAGGMGS